MNIIANNFLLSLKRNATYKQNLLFLVLDELICFVSVFVFWSSLQEVGLLVPGWGRDSRIVFIGLNLISTAISDVFVGVYDLQDQILSGELDLSLLKPTNPWLFVILQRCNFLRFLITFPLGLLVAGWTIPLWQMPQFLLAVLTCILATLILELLVACVYVLAFWMRKVGVLAELLETLFSVKRYPIQGNHSFWLRWLTTLLPVAYVASFPTNWLATGQGFERIGIVVLGLVAVSLLLVFLWKKGRQVYESAN